MTSSLSPHDLAGFPDVGHAVWPAPDAAVIKEVGVEGDNVGIEASLDLTGLGCLKPEGSGSVRRSTRNGVEIGHASVDHMHNLLGVLTVQRTAEKDVRSHRNSHAF